MGKIVLLVPREEMLRQAHNILQEKTYEIQEMRVITTESAVMEARQSIADGASIIIARGLQASLIKQYTDIPVVEMVLTAQEMALLIRKARQIIKKSKPIIGVVGFPNMFCDMSYFDELYEIVLRTYYVHQGEELPSAVENAVKDGVDLIIGGELAVTKAAESGVPSLFLSVPEDSLRQAFAMAERMDYAVCVEKKTAAQMETLLDYSYNGILQLNGKGIITAANPRMEDLVGRTFQELKGLFIREAVPGIGEEELEQVLVKGEECSLFLEGDQGQVFAVMAPVLLEGRVEGAILTCHKMQKKLSQKKQEGRQRQGLPPLVRFEDILQKSKSMKECVHKARLYALSGQPVVLMGEPGTEKRMLAESIHNESSRGNGPFLDVPCGGLSGEQQRGMLFGGRGAVFQANGGSLLIQDVQELTWDNQYRLYQLIHFHVCHGEEIASLRRVDVRVMVTLKRTPMELMEAGKLREDLGYLLSGLEVKIPPFRERPEDLRQKLDDTIRECCERYSRYHVLTAGGKKRLLEYSWKGNLFQIESFCDRLILTARKRTLDEIVVVRLLDELYSQVLSADQEKERNFGEGGTEEPFGGNEEAKRVADVLRRYGGNQEKAAKELGISKATLWRRRKKYGIE